MRVLVAACFLMSACGAPEPPPMSVADARAELQQVARGNAQAFCSAEGRTAFRQAVRNLSAAADAAGEQSTDLLETDDPVWNLVFIGLMANIVEPSDLRGDMRRVAAGLNFASMMGGEVRQARAALDEACPELITVYRAAAEVERLQARLERLDNRDVGRMQDVSRRLASAQERMMRALRRLEDKMEAAGVAP